MDEKRRVLRIDLARNGQGEARSRIRAFQAGDARDTGGCSLTRASLGGRG